MNYGVTLNNTIMDFSVFEHCCKQLGCMYTAQQYIKQRHRSSSSLCNLLLGFVERKTIRLTEHAQLQNISKIPREITLIPHDED